MRLIALKTPKESRTLLQFRSLSLFKPTRRYANFPLQPHALSSPLVRNLINLPRDLIHSSSNFILTCPLKSTENKPNPPTPPFFLLTRRLFQVFCALSQCSPSLYRNVDYPLASSPHFRVLSCSERNTNLRRQFPTGPCVLSYPPSFGSQLPTPAQRPPSPRS